MVFSCKFEYLLSMFGDTVTWKDVAAKQEVDSNRDRDKNIPEIFINPPQLLIFSLISVYNLSIYLRDGGSIYQLIVKVKVYLTIAPIEHMIY